MSGHKDSPKNEIREARERRGMTQQEVADAVGVNLRTYGSWERGTSVPRDKSSELNAVLGLTTDLSKDNRVELAALIREQLALMGWGAADLAAQMPGTDKRNVYNWLSGANRPQKRVWREIETALGWEAGSVGRVLDAPITNIPSLSEVRDWSLVEQPPKTRISDVSTPELLMELSARWKWMEERLEAAQSKEDNPGNVRNLFDLAAHNTSAGRNMEHLEDD